MSSSNGYGAAVFPQHAALLAASRIHPDVAHERGYRSADSKAQLERHGIPHTYRNVPGLLIPLHGTAGVVGYQYRPDEPVHDDYQRQVRYVTAPEYGVRLDLHPRTHPHLADTGTPLLITEGMRKVDALLSAGAKAVLGLTGVWMWRDSDGTLGDWHDVALKDRLVLIAFDHDVQRKPAVRKACVELAKWLRGKGADVEYLWVPDLGDGKTGVDDYLAGGGTLPALLKTATKTFAPPGGDTGSGKTGSSMREQLLDLAQQRFLLGLTTDDRVFVVDRDGPNLALGSGHAKRALAHLAYQTTGKVPGRTPLDEAWTVLEGMAQSQPKSDLPMRVAVHDGSVVIDTGAPDGGCMVVDAHGWRAVTRSPVTFRRSRATMPLPAPAATGDWEPLWDAVNVHHDDRQILRGWLVSALIRGIPHPVLQIRGEQGSAKTTATGALAQLIDPCAAATLQPPHDAAAWAGHVTARWVVPVDNVSRIEPWWSDALCRTVTGSGEIKRALYTDDEHVVQTLRGVVILNGIGLSSALRGDLAERLLPVELRRPAQYRTESDVQRTLTDAHPVILAALLGDLAATLAAQPVTPQPTGYRMADFAHVLAAHDTATGGTATTDYGRMHDDAAEDALEDDMLAQCVVSLMHGRDTWTGTASELLSALEREREALSHQPEWWPKTPTVLAGALTRSGPLLRLRGITYERMPRTKHDRKVRLSRTGDRA